MIKLKKTLDLFNKLIYMKDYLSCRSDSFNVCLTMVYAYIFALMCVSNYYYYFINNNI